MKESLSLYELNRLIKSSLQETLPDSYWVQAEIASCNVRSGHCYMELIEKREGSDLLKAKARAVIWSNVWVPLKIDFEKQTGSTLSMGQKILVEVGVDYHELYGMTLVVYDIDPSYTLGEWALCRRKVIEQLQQEGVFSLNKELPEPILPQRIAVISSPSSAGYQDFMHQLNQDGLIFYTHLFPALMQGEQAVDSILKALDDVLERVACFDMVVIIRGGGATTDLSCFDNYDLASSLAQFPLPIVSGIGHERDVSVVDMVSYASLKTPTAVAEYLLGKLRMQAEGLDKKISQISDCINSRYQREMQSLQQRLYLLMHLVSKRQSEEKLQIQKQLLSLQQLVVQCQWTENKKRAEYEQGLRQFVEKRMQAENHRVALLEKSIMSYSPELQLKRGFSITSFQGRILKSSEGLPAGALIETRLKEGILITKTLDNPSEPLQT